MNSKEQWEAFLLAQNLPPFLQSWNAAEMNEKLGHKTLYLGIYENEQLEGICLIELIEAKRGKYLFVPYGPVFRQIRKDLVHHLVEYLSSWGKENRFHFIRLAPYWDMTEANLELLASFGFHTAPIHALSEIVWKLDLDKTEDELLMGMRKNTRNLIRRARKEGVVVKKSTSKDSVDTFIGLMEETHKRHGFVAYPDELYHQQVEAFRSDDQVVVFSGEHAGKCIASSIVMYYGNAASYHHGASEPSKIPVAYLLQWEAILEAKRRGCREYSFWGIVETDDKSHPFYGITTFKKGFGGSIRHLIPAHDKPLSWRYGLTYVIETVRRVKRGFGFKREG